MKKLGLFAALLFCNLFPKSMAGEPTAVAAEYDCLIDPWQQVNVSFADKGVINVLTVQQGDAVKEGQLLAELESGLEQANIDLSAAKASMDDEIRGLAATLAYNQRNLKRFKDLYEQKAIPLSNLDEAETAVTVANQQLLTAKTNQRLAGLDLAMAKERLQRRRMVSPINGVVAKLRKFKGEYVEYEPMVTLNEISRLRAQVLLPLALINKVHVGMNATIIPESPMNNLVREGKVIVVDSGVDVASGTFGVQVEIDNKELNLVSGLKCNIRFDGI
jgi:RND family efflux transporter MFP subunit